MNVVAFWASVATGLILFLICLLVVLNQPTWVTNITGTISLGTAILGFALAVFGGVKSILGVTGGAGIAPSEVVPAGGAAAAGAVLLVASQFIGGA